MIAFIKRHWNAKWTEIERDTLRERYARLCQTAKENTGLKEEIKTAHDACDELIVDLIRLTAETQRISAECRSLREKFAAYDAAGAESTSGA